MPLPRIYPIAAVKVRFNGQYPLRAARTTPSKR